MTAIPVWLKGSNVTACAIVPQTVASDGTLSAGASSNLVGSIDSISVQSTAELEEISPMTTTRRNMVPIKTGTTITLVEILKSNGTNLLAAVAYAATYVQVSLTRGGQAFSFYGVVADYNEDLQRGKSVGTMVIDMVDISSTNPTYT
jgi:hypothetical protein